MNEHGAQICAGACVLHVLQGRRCMFVQWTAKKLQPLGRSPWRGHISYRAVLVKSEWFGGKARKTNRYLATVKFQPGRGTSGGKFIKTESFLGKCRYKLKELAIGDADQHRILLRIEKYLADTSGPPICPRLHDTKSELSF